MNYSWNKSITIKSPPPPRFIWFQSNLESEISIKKVLHVNIFKMLSRARRVIPCIKGLTLIIPKRIVVTSPRQGRPLLSPGQKVILKLNVVYYNKFMACWWFLCEILMALAYAEKKEVEIVAHLLSCFTIMASSFQGLVRNNLMANRCEKVVVIGRIMEIV